MTLQNSSSKIFLNRPFIFPKRRINVDHVDHPPAFTMSFILTPMLFTLLLDALQVECDVKAVISIPASPKNVFMLCATVAKMTGL